MSLTRSRVSQLTRPGTVLLALVMLLLAVPAAAQVVTGVVVDEVSGAPVPGVRLTLLAGARVVARTEARDDGGFRFRPVRPGSYTLRASRMGYLMFEAPQVTVGEGEEVTTRVRMVVQPIEMEALAATGRSRLDQEATLQGALARREVLPSAGTRRVMTRDDHEMRAAFSAGDVLRWLPPSYRCMVVFVDGRPELSREMAAERMSTPVAGIEAIEFYRWWHDAPLNLKYAPPYAANPSRCSVLAIWSRVD
jgi:hypothetical protein